MENNADIELRYMIFRTEPVVQLIFEYNSDLIRRLKAYTTAWWSNSMHCWYIPCKEFHPENFRRDFGTDYYLHATSAHATAILSSVKGRLTANGKIRLTALFTKPDLEKEAKMQQFRSWMVSKRLQVLLLVGALIW